MSIWGWIWFLAFVVACGYIVLMKRGGAIDRDKEKAALDEAGGAVKDAAVKAKQRFDEFREKP